MPDYSKGKIYKIVNSVNDKVYIGSTTSRLCDRMSRHRYQAISLHAQYGKLYKSMRFHGAEKFKIKLITDYPCVTKEELFAKEFGIIKQHVARGTVLYNTVIEEGKHADDTKRRMSKRTRGSGNNQYGKVGAASARFNRGSVCFCTGEKPSWRFSWRENGKQRSKTFSPNKFGYDEAKRLAEEYRDQIYPVE